MEAAAANPNDVQVQHVTKKSSDELLRKFAELDEDDGGGGKKGAAFRKELRVMVVKRRKRSGFSRSRRESLGHCESPSNNGTTGLVERKWLLPPPATRRSTFLKQLGIGRSQIRAREIRNRSIFGTIEKVLFVNPLVNFWFWSLYILLKI